MTLVEEVEMDDVKTEEKTDAVGAIQSAQESETKPRKSAQRRALKESAAAGVPTLTGAESLPPPNEEASTAKNIGDPDQGWASLVDKADDSKEKEALRMIGKLEKRVSNCATALSKAQAKRDKAVAEYSKLQTKKEIEASREFRKFLIEKGINSLDEVAKTVDLAIANGLSMAELRAMIVKNRKPIPELIANK